jgi:hypothetical protein
VISGGLKHLCDYMKRSEKGAVMLFPAPASLIATAQILYDIAAGSQYYRFNGSNAFDQVVTALTNVQVNCWFFMSMIHEILVRNLECKYRSGHLNHHKLVNQYHKESRGGGPCREAGVIVILNPYMKL